MIPNCQALVLAAAGLLAAAPALAQQRNAAPSPTQPAPATAETGPERTVAQFGDWAVQCVTLAQGPNAGRRICEMAQTVQDQTRNQPIAVIALGRLAREQPMKLAVRVPVNVMVSSPAQFTLEGGGNNSDLPMAFTRCTITPVGCYAEREMREDALRRLRARPAEQAGRITWRDATGSEVAIPVSFRGFAGAYEALVKEGG